MERLFEQAGLPADVRRLRIESQRRARNDWLDMNYEAASYFSRRYRAIRALTSHAVEWQIGDIFTLERVVERLRQRDRFKKNTSAAKAANQVKFYVHPRMYDRPSDGILLRADGFGDFNPNGICSEFAEDWARIAKHPFPSERSEPRSPSARRASCRQSTSQMSRPLMPVFRQDRGSLVGPHDNQRDLAVLFPRAIDDAPPRSPGCSGRHTALTEAWERFRASYENAVTECFR